MPTLIDPRGPRFAATLTSLVLALVLLTAPGPFATALLAAQAAVFAVGAAAGVQRTPYAWLFRTLLRPRLGRARRARGRGAAAVRAGRRARLRAGRPASGC